jgi:subfamily B ATP-binding cassette protein MsbA
MLLRGLLDFLNNYCSEWTSQKVLADIRYELMQRIAAQSMDFFNDSRSGALIQRVANETRAMQSLLTTLSTQMITQPTTLISGLFVLFKLDWRFTAVALVAIPCALVPLLFFWKEIRRMSSREEVARGDLVAHLHEFFGGIKVIKAFARTRHELERFDARSRAEFRQTMKTRCMVESTAPIVECLAAVGIAVGLYHVYSVGMSGITFVSLCAGIFLLYQPLKTMARTNLFLAQGYQVAESVVAMMRLQPSVTDAPGAIELTACDGAIECADVTFSYRPGIPALADFSFRFESGKFYALVGESGAGKSTLFSLILRFYDVDQGSIRLGGKDLRSVTQDSLRGQIGIVTQDTFLFHESIYQNILYGRLDATRDEVLRAAELAHAHAFIMAQQNGYDTIVGDKGCKLSGGQQQRVAIARALLKNAPVLLLDEATSSLDSVSERHIQAAIGNLASGRTVIAIAHRLSTILQADQILVLDRGRLLEVGTHRELLQHSGIYRRLYDVQFG